MTAQMILPGDKVATWKDVVFLHPMIHVGDGWFVEKAKTGVIRMRHLASLPKGQPIQVMQRPVPHEAPSVVQRALSRLGWEPYDAATSNCQHFANEVMTGQRKSEQVDLVKTILIAAGVAVALGALFSK